MKCALSLIVLFTGGLTHAAMGQNNPSRPEKPKPQVTWDDKQARETPHLLFVEEYLRELMADENLQNQGLKEFDKAKTASEQLMAGIYVFTSDQLELHNQIAMLKSMQLNAPFDKLIPALVSINQRQIDLYEQAIEIDKKLLEGPKAGVDYAALSARVPQLRAELGSVQEGVYKAAALVFSTLIDLKPDSQKHLSHLVITKAEKAELLNQLDIMLKDEPTDGDDLDYYVSAAMLLRGGLNKGHKCADEPWE